MATLLSPFTAIGSSLRRRNATQVDVDQQGKAFTPIPDLYTLRQAYYDSAQYDLALDGTLFRQTSGIAGVSLQAVNNLPRDIRAVLPLVKPAIDWWRDNLYRGTWTHDGRAAPSGQPNAIPWADDVPDELVRAAHQAFTWGNWAQKIRVWSLLGPMLGDVFAEIEIDYDRQKVYPVVRHPRDVVHLAFNGSDDVIAYKLAVQRWNPVAEETYTWGKLVTKNRFVTYYDDRPMGFSTITGRDDEVGLVPDASVEPEVPNPFGFVPAVWVNHDHVGGVHGAPVIDGLYRLIDDLNGSQSAVDDYIMQLVKQYHVIASDDPAGFGKVIDAIKKVQSATTEAGSQSSRETIRLIPGPPNAKAFPLIEDIGLAASAVHFDRMMELVERNLPESSIEEKLASRAQLTGPGARAIVAPVQRKLDACTPGYDLGIGKLGQMATSIQGEFANNDPRWRATEQQQLFLPFDLKSWDRGELSALSIAPRELVGSTMLERATEAMAVESLTTVWGKVHAGLSTADIYGIDTNGVPNPAPPYGGILAEQANAAAQAAAAMPTF